MTGIRANTWMEANQRYLTAELDRIRALLQGCSEKEGTEKTEKKKSAEQKQPMVSASLEQLCRIFTLSDFERDILLLCAATELDSSFASLCAAAYDNPKRNYPTFSLVLALFPGAHWSAITPSAPLRYWQLISIQPADTLVNSQLRIDEQILHYLTGLQHLHEQLSGYVQPMSEFDSEALVPTQRELAEKIAIAWSNPQEKFPVVQVCGQDIESRRQVALCAAKEAGFNVHLMAAEALPPSPSELDHFIRLWERQAVLDNSVLLVDYELNDQLDAARRNQLANFLGKMRDLVIVSTQEPLRIVQRRSLLYEIPMPTKEEQRVLWEKYLAEAGVEQSVSVERFITQFNINAQEIRDACNQGAAEYTDKKEEGTLEEHLWSACRRQTQPKMHGLAQRIETVATREDLVLPSNQHNILSNIVMHVRQRHQVYEQWGFRRKSARGLGISVLFSGPSGTGKTMAAEVLANELSLDLYRIDLSQVVSKYIGETEKNLRRVFDGAEDSAAILLFDEADALFGKRSEVKDSHDRYANIEVSYLLQRMESYRGLAILTTNLKEALDDAFIRRIRFVVSFPFPGMDARERIWQRIFPEETPISDLDTARLAQLNITGGSIQNIALQAAFIAADAEETVAMNHLLRAARSEYAKIEKPLVDSDIRGWI